MRVGASLLSTVPIRFCSSRSMVRLPATWLWRRSRVAAFTSPAASREIAHKLDDGRFVRAFTGKGRFGDLLRRHPLHIVTDSKVGLKGALLLIRKKTRA